MQDVQVFVVTTDPSLVKKLGTQTTLHYCRLK